MIFKKSREKLNEELKKEQELQKQRYIKLARKSEYEKLKDKVNKLKKERFNKSLHGKLLNRTKKIIYAKVKQRTSRPRKSVQSFGFNPLGDGNGIGFDPLREDKPRRKRQRDPWDVF